MGDFIDSTLYILIKGTHTERKGNAPTRLIFDPNRLCKVFTFSVTAPRLAPPNENKLLSTRAFKS